MCPSPMAGQRLGGLLCPSIPRCGNAAVGHSAARGASHYSTASGARLDEQSATCDGCRSAVRSAGPGPLGRLVPTGYQVHWTGTSWPSQSSDRQGRPKASWFRDEPYVPDGCSEKRRLPFERVAVRGCLQRPLVLGAGQQRLVRCLHAARPGPAKQPQSAPSNSGWNCCFFQQLQPSNSGWNMNIFVLLPSLVAFHREDEPRLPLDRPVDSGQNQASSRRSGSPCVELACSSLYTQFNEIRQSRR